MNSSKEFEKRALALEQKGLEVEVVGRKPQPLKVQRERALGRFLGRLILEHTGRRIGISVSGVPRLKGGHMSLGIALDIPVGLKLRLSKQDKRELESFLVHAIEESGQLLRSEPTPRHSRPGHRTTARRASTGS